MRILKLLFLSLILSCVSSGFAQTTARPGNPRYWDEVCKEKCKNPITVQMVEKGTGRKYKIGIAVLGIQPGVGCECTDKRYKNGSENANALESREDKRHEDRAMKQK